MVVFIFDKILEQSLNHILSQLAVIENILLDLIRNKMCCSATQGKTIIL